MMGKQKQPPQLGLYKVRFQNGNTGIEGTVLIAAYSFTDAERIVEEKLLGVPIIEILTYMVPIEHGTWNWY